MRTRIVLFWLFGFSRWGSGETYNLLGDGSGLQLKRSPIYRYASP